MTSRRTPTPLKVTHELSLELDVFRIEDWRHVVRTARRTCGCVYTWITFGRQNWLEKGLHIFDVMGLVILPRGLPDTIDLADDRVD